MRKMTALMLMALMALAMTFTAVGCGQQAAEQTPAETPSEMPHEGDAMMDTSAAPMDTGSAGGSH